MTSLPVISWHLTCAPEFQRAARYTVTMLGMMAGFRARWATSADGGPTVCWGSPPEVEVPTKAASTPYGSTDQHSTAGLSLPADPGAQKFLLVRGYYNPEHVRECCVAGSSILSLFRGAADVHAALPDGTDLIACAFFFLSLHEEWSSSVRDGFDRFPSSASLLGTLHQLHRPVVAEYARVLRDLLHAAGFDVPTAPRWNGRASAVCMTHDVDYVRKFTAGLIWREVVRYALRDDLDQPLRARLRRLGEFAGFLDPSRDPYRVSLARLLDREAMHEVHATWFFKAGVTDRHDVRYSLHTSYLQEVLRRMKDAGHEVGLHPSFNAHVHADIAATERDRLEAASGRDIATVRQHYLRFHYPRTWRMHEDLGVQVDSTLGFADHEGFRNGVCHPFLPYDLERRRVIPLIEIPLQVMDGTLAFYRAMAPDTALDAIRALLDTVHRHEGAAVVLFHNTCDDAHDFPGWSGVADAVYGAIGGDDRLARVSLGEAAGMWLSGGGWDSAAQLAASIEAD